MLANSSVERISRGVGRWIETALAPLAWGLMLRPWLRRIGDTDFLVADALPEAAPPAARTRSDDGAVLMWWSGNDTGWPSSVCL
jgi:hypothetical protein